VATPFLSARWEDLILVTYRMPAELPAPLVPAGLELDRYDGSACASLVGFRFLSTRVFGLRWPFHSNFPEFNLRYYVRETNTPSPRRGVMFVREYVPRRAIAWTARLIYNEPYRFAPMTEELRSASDQRFARYGLRVHGREHAVQVESDPEPSTPKPGTIEHFFKEHQWGFGVTRRGRVIDYEVRHPTWAVYRPRRWHVDVDWRVLYGPGWRVMQDAEPLSVVHAVGSGVEVHPARTDRLTPSAS